MASAFVCEGNPVAPACIICASPSPSARTCSRPCTNTLSQRTRSENAAIRNARTCQRCGIHFQKTRNAPGRFCSQDCSNASRRLYASDADARRAERERWKERTGWAPAPRPLPRQPAPAISRACGCCGAVFETRRNTHLYCSRACARRQARKGTDRQDRKHIDRARKYGVAYEPVNRIKLFERDRWRCQICGTKTPRRLMGSIAQNAPEMDHRIPLAMGGPHSWANCQCACRRCNGMKGATVIVGQLPLFASPA